jgi:hypothetical protein
MFTHYRKKGMTQKDYEEIVETYYNGNISTAKEAIKKLNKHNTVELIFVWAEYMKRENTATSPYELAIYKVFQLL